VVSDETGAFDDPVSFDDTAADRVEVRTRSVRRAGRAAVAGADRRPQIEAATAITNATMDDTVTSQSPSPA
jgi:hypothetical protein